MLAMTIMGLMPQNFFPNMDKPYLRADCFLPEGYSIRETEKEMGKIEEFLLQQEEVVNVSVHTEAHHFVTIWPVLLSVRNLISVISWSK